MFRSEPANFFQRNTQELVLFALARSIALVSSDGPCRALNEHNVAVLFLFAPCKIEAHLYWEVCYGFKEVQRVR